MANDNKFTRLTGGKSAALGRKEQREAQRERLKDAEKKLKSQITDRNSTLEQIVADAPEEKRVKLREKIQRYTDIFKGTMRVAKESERDPSEELISIVDALKDEIVQEDLLNEQIALTFVKSIKFIIVNEVFLKKLKDRATSQHMLEVLETADQPDCGMQVAQNAKNEFAAAVSALPTHLQAIVEGRFTAAAKSIFAASVDIAPNISILPKLTTACDTVASELLAQYSDQLDPTELHAAKDAFVSFVHASILKAEYKRFGIGQPSISLLETPGDDRTR